MVKCKTIFYLTCDGSHLSLKNIFFFTVISIKLILFYAHHESWPISRSRGTVLHFKVFLLLKELNFRTIGYLKKYKKTLKVSFQMQHKSLLTTVHMCKLLCKSTASNVHCTVYHFDWFFCSCYKPFVELNGRRVGGMGSNLQ